MARIHVFSSSGTVVRDVIIGLPWRVSVTGFCGPDRDASSAFDNMEGSDAVPQAAPEAQAGRLNFAGGRRRARAPADT